MPEEDTPAVRPSGTPCPAAGLRRKALRGAKWTLLSEALTQFVSIAVVIILARTLGPEPFALIAIAAAVIAITGVFAQLGFSQALVQRQELDTAHIDTAFWTVVGLGLLGATILYLGAPALARAYQMPELQAVLATLSLLPILASLSSIHAALLQRDMSFASLAKRQILSSLVGASAALAAAAAGWGVWALVVQRLSASLAAMAFLWIAHPWRPRLYASARCFRDLFSYGFVVSLHHAFLEIARRIDVMLLGIFLSPKDLGYFQTAKTLTVTVTSIINRATHSVLFSGFSKLQKDEAALLKGFLQASRYISLISLPTFTGAAIFSREIVLLVLGEDWLPAAPAVSLLSISGALNSLLWLCGTVYAAKAKNIYNLSLLALQTALTATAIIAFAHRGLIAMIAAIVIARILVAPIRFLLLKRLVPWALASYVLAITPGLLAALGVALGSYTWSVLYPEASAISTLMGGPLFGILFTALFLMSFERKTLKMLWSDLNIMLAKRIS